MVNLALLTMVIAVLLQLVPDPLVENGLILVFIRIEKIKVLIPFLVFQGCRVIAAVWKVAHHFGNWLQMAFLVLQIVVKLNISICRNHTDMNATDLP